MTPPICHLPVVAAVVAVVVPSVAAVVAAVVVFAQKDVAKWFPPKKNHFPNSRSLSRKLHRRVNSLAP